MLLLIERLCRIQSRILQQHIIATRMLRQECGSVVDFAVDEQPTVEIVGVFGVLLPRNNTIHLIIKKLLLTDCYNHILPAAT